MITHLLDSISRRTNIEIISMHHEQGAAFAAEGFARIKGEPGIALATSGPGATNLITGIGSCYFDSVPSIFITGQVNTTEKKGNLPIRQLGFQETDICSIIKPLVKSAFIVESPESIPHILDEAFSISTSGRPGPVLIDIPMDIQRAEINYLNLPDKSTLKEKYDYSFFERLFLALNQSNSPLILAGGGIRSSKSIKAFREFIQNSEIPVVFSLMGVDVLPYAVASRVGMIGSYGNRWANTALAESDLLIVLGSRLDIRQTGSRTDLFKSNRKIFHVDCDEGEVNNRIKGCDYSIMQLNTFLNGFNQFLLDKQSRLSLDIWKNRIQVLKNKFPDVKEHHNGKGINPNALIHLISKHASSSTAFIVDVGQHQMWAAQSIELSENQRFITSGGMGAMGFALPAGIGASFANNRSCVTVIAGDGGFQLNLQELQTIVRNNLPVKIIILNNNAHGMVRQFQESYFESRYQSTVDGYSAPSFTKIALAYGIKSHYVSNNNDLDHALKDLYSNPLEPRLLEIFIDTQRNAYPKMAFGRPINEMEPEFNSLDMEST
jgi:acetolactate synthase-1/2/3 large subunit